MRKSAKTISATAISAGIIVSIGQVSADEPKLRPLVNSSASVETTARATEALQVVIDFARILTLDRAAKTIVLGNSGILDATINDERTVVLTGKSAGATNMIVLGENNREILNASVNVVPSSQVTTVYHGLRRQTYSCVSGCTPVLSVGDAAQHFDPTNSQIQARQEFATGSSAKQ